MSLSTLFSVELCVRVMQVLIHSLWQGLLLAAVVTVVNVLARRQSASLRYTVSLVALLLMVACLPFTFWLTAPAEEPASGIPPVAAAPQSPEFRPMAEITAPPAIPVEALASAAGVADALPSASEPAVAAASPVVDVLRPERAAEPPTAAWWVSPYIVAMYGVGVLLMFVRLLLALGGGERLKGRSVPVRDAEILDRLAAKAKALGLRAAPTASRCERVMVPVVVGVFRPTILLPVAILTGMTLPEIEAVLAHELAHIRRRDHLAILLQRTVEAVLFYHPAVWYVSRCVSRERENCCDDLVLATGTEAASYAELLVRVAEMNQSHRLPSATALAASGPRPTRLRERVLRILGTAVEAPFRVSRTAAAVSVLLVSLVGLTLALGIDGSESAGQLNAAEWERLQHDFQTLHDRWQATHPLKTDRPEAEPAYLMIDTTAGRLELIQSGQPFNEEAALTLPAGFGWRLEYINDSGMRPLESPAFFRQPPGHEGDAYPWFSEYVCLVGRSSRDSLRLEFNASGWSGGHPAGDIGYFDFAQNEEGAQSILVEGEERVALLALLEPAELQGDDLASAERAVAVLEDRQAGSEAVEEAISTLTELGPGVAEMLIPLLKGGVTDVRAMEVLNELADEPHVQRAMRRAVTDADERLNPNTIHCGLTVLGNSGNAAHADFIAGYLETNTLAATGALGQLGGAPAREHLEEAFDRVPSELWFVIATKLQQLGDPAAIPALKKWLQRVELPPSEKFPRATVPSFIAAIRQLEFERDGTRDNGATSYSFGQGISFRYPFDGQGLPKTFTTSPQPRDHHVRLPQVDPDTPEGRTAIWQALDKGTDGPGFTLDGENIVTFHHLRVAPLWSEGRPYPTTLFDWLEEMPHCVIRDQAEVWLARGELKQGPVPGSHTMPVPANSLLVALDPEDNRLTVLSLQKATDDFQYKVTLRPLDPLRLLVAATGRAFPATMGFTPNRYCDLYDLESERRDGALNLNIAQRVRMTQELWRHPQRDAILTAEFAGGDVALGIPGVERFQIVEAPGCWDDPQRTVTALAQVARTGEEQAPGPQRLENDGAVFYRFPDRAVGREYAFVARMPQGLPVAGVLQVKNIDRKQQVVRIDHRYLPTAVAQNVIDGRLPQADTPEENDPDDEDAGASVPTAPEAASRPTSLRVRILDQDGQPLVNRAVRLAGASIGYPGERFPASGSTDREGMVKVEAIWSGWPVFVVNPGWPNSFIWQPEVPAEGLQTELRLKPMPAWWSDGTSQPQLDVKAIPVERNGKQLLLVTVTNEGTEPYVLTENDLRVFSPDYIVYPPVSEQLAGLVVPPGRAKSREITLNWNEYVHRGIWCEPGPFSFPHPATDLPDDQTWVCVEVASTSSLAFGVRRPELVKQQPREDGGTWGRAVSGVQTQLVADRSVWPVGEPPSFAAAVRNRGNGDLTVVQAQQLCEVEVEGRWYRWYGPSREPDSPLMPGRLYEGIPIVLDHHWRGREDLQPLRLEAGWHMVRVAFLPQAAGNDEEPEPLRVVSNPVQIELAPVTWGQPVDGIRVGIVISPHIVSAGKVPHCLWCIGNTSDQPRTVWQGEEDLVSLGPAGEPRTTYSRGLRGISGVTRQPEWVVLKPGEMRSAVVNLNALRSDHGPDSQVQQPINSPGTYELAAVYDPAAPQAMFHPPEKQEDFPDVLYRRVESGPVQLTVTESSSESGSASADGNAQAPQKAKPSVELAIWKEGDRFPWALDGLAISPDELTEKLQARLRQDMNLQLKIRAESEVHYSQLAAAIESAKTAGVRKVIFSAGGEQLRPDAGGKSGNSPTADGGPAGEPAAELAIWKKEEKFRWTLDGLAVSPDQLTEQLQSRIRQDRNQHLRIRVGLNVPYAQITTAIDLAKAAGVEKFVLSATRGDADPPE